MKKILFLGILALLNFYPTNIQAAQLDDLNSITQKLINEDGDSINVIFNEGTIDKISNDEILDIISDCEEGDTITIYNVSDSSESEQEDNDNSKIIGVTTYKTEKTYTSKEVLEKEHLIISVAKGQTTTLSSSKTITSELSVSGSYYDYGKLDLTKSKSYTVSKSDTFTGPAESSVYNTRLYYAREYVNKGSYKQYQCFNNFCSDVAKTGTFKEPAKIISYSRDSKY